MDAHVLVTAVAPAVPQRVVRRWEKLAGTLQILYYSAQYNHAGMNLLVACGFLMYPIASSLWPINLSTAVTLIAAVFPCTAGLYLQNLGTRIDEVDDAARRYELHNVYFRDFESSEAERKFTIFLLRRFKEYYSPVQLSAFALAAGIITFITVHLLIEQAQITKLPVVPADVETHSILLMAGFFGAFCGALLVIVKKYRSFDIYPATYLHSAIALVVGTVAGAALTAIYPSDHLAFVIFAIGFFTATHMTFFGEFLRDRLANLAGVHVVPEIPTDLDKVVRNSDAIESLNALSLNSVAELVKAEPLTLYLNLPQSIGVINGWLDEALLQYYFPTRIEQLREAGVVRFTQLVELAASQMDENGIKWNGGSMLITGDVETDKRLLVTARGVVESRVHHRQLGVIWQKYRGTFFGSCAPHSVPSEQELVPEIARQAA